MDVNNAKLLSYTVKNCNCEGCDESVENQVNGLVEEETNYLGDVELNGANILGEDNTNVYDVSNIGTNVTDEELVKLAETPRSFVTVVQGEDNSNAIDNKSFITVVPEQEGISGADDRTFVTVVPDEEVNPLTPEENIFINVNSIPVTFANESASKADAIKLAVFNSYRNSIAKGYTIKNADSMFKYLEQISRGTSVTVNKSTGITRAQLIQLTKHDKMEDENSDFFGSINRIFDVLDKGNKDDVLSYEEVEKFLGDNLMQNASDYKTKVQSYTNSIQQDFSKLSGQKKLEFVLEKTEVYLRSAGMTNQLKALARLTNGQYASSYYDPNTMPDAGVDQFATIKVGQIGIRDLNAGKTGPGTTLGEYSFGCYHVIYDNKYDATIWATDKDEGGVDRGLSIDISQLNNKWYQLVDVMVHELTHATAYQYLTDERTAIIKMEKIDEFYSRGLLTRDEYDYIKDHNDTTFWWKEPEPELLKKLYYLVDCSYGEYAAYQVDADYADSIAADVYDGKYVISTAVNGINEQSQIEGHIESLYNGAPYTTESGEYWINTQSVPTYKWWTYDEGSGFIA